MYNHTDRVAHTTDCGALAGIFYMYTHTDRVAHTTDCAALVGYFTRTITHTGYHTPRIVLHWLEREIAH